MLLPSSGSLRPAFWLHEVPRSSEAHGLCPFMTTYFTRAMPSWFPHVLACAGISFCSELNEAPLCVWTTFCCACPPLCTDTSGSHPPVAGSMGVQTYCGDSAFSSFRYPPRSRTAGSGGASVLTFCSNCCKYMFSEEAALLRSHQHEGSCTLANTCYFRGSLW